MSLLGAIVDYYNEGTSTDLETLRNALGEGMIFADAFPAGFNPPKPYCVLSELQTESLNEAKSPSKRNRILRVLVAFMVFGTGRAQVEAVLEALDNVYTSQEAELTISDRQHLATYFSNRTSSIDEKGWFGTLELDFRLSKSGD